MGAQTLCILLMLCLASPVARADCPAAPIADPDDMAISFLAANGVQAASASLLTSSVKEGTLVYDDANDVLKVCDGTSWIEVGSGSGTDTLASLSCSSGQIAKWNGTAWACSADGGGGGGTATAPGFLVHKNGTNQTVTATSYQKLTWSTEVFDIGDDFASSRFTPTVAGRYVFSLNIYCIDTPSYCHPVIYKNGAQVAGNVGANSSNQGVGTSAIVDMNGTTDYVEAYVYNYGTTINGNTWWTNFSGSLVGGGSDTLTGLSCATNEIPKWNGSAWACAADGGGSGGSSSVRSATFGYRSGSIAILASQGITSIVRTAAGTYRVIWTTPFADDDYLVFGSCNAWGSGGAVFTLEGNSGGASSNVAQLTTRVDVGCRTGTNTNTDVETVSLVAVPVNGFGGGGSDTLADLSCATNEIPKWNGAAWACASDGGGGSGSAVYVQATQNAGLTIGTTATVIPFADEVSDASSAFNPTTGVFTAPSAGYYMVSASWFTGASPTMQNIVLYKNGAVFKITSGVIYNTNGRSAAISSAEYLAAGDTLQIRGTVGSGTVTTSGGASSNYLAIVSMGGGATASADGGAGQVQFNEGGNLKADAGLHWDNTNKRLTISSNAAPLDVGPFTNTVLHLSNVDGTSPRLLLDQFGGGNVTAANVTLRSAGGTGASPTALSDEDILGQLTFTGHIGTSYVGARAAVRGTATEAWSGSGNGADLRFHTTPNGTVDAIETMRLNHDGALSLGSGTDASASSILDLTSTTLGFLPPRMTTVQRDAIASPAVGLMIFDTTAAQYQFWNGTAWSGLGSGGVPTGTIAAFALATCPSGWTEYTAARGRFLRGIDPTGASVDPDGTRAPGNLQADAMQQITGSMGFNRTAASNLVGAFVGGGTPGASGATSGSNAAGSVAFNSANSPSARTSVETRPKNVAVLFCQYNGSGGGGGGSSQWTDVTGGINYAGGKVGIGTTAPAGPLHVVTTAAVPAITMERTGDANVFLEFESTTGLTGVDGGGSSGFLRFYTAGAQRMIVNSAGNIGIGTTTPQSLLQVAGGIQLADDAAACPGASNVKLGTLKYGSNVLSVCNTGGWTTLTAGGGTLSGGTSGYLGVWTGATTMGLSSTVAGQSLFWDATNHRLGIGTTNPQDALDLGLGTSGRSIVWGGSTGTNHYASVGTTYSFGSLSLVRGLKLATGGADQYLYSYATGSRAGIRIGGGSASDISFFNEPAATQTVGDAFDYVANTKMTIKDSGNVGVGTTAPSSLLHVKKDQTAATTQILVENVGAADPATISALSVGEGGVAYGSLRRYRDGSGTVELANVQNAPLHLLTNNIRRLTILGTGNVGIGTTTPQSLLSVADTGYAQFGKTFPGAPTTADCDAVAEAGRVTIDTTNGRWYVCDGVAWKFVSIGTSGSGGSSQWTTAGSHIHYATGGVAIGQASAPEASAALEVESTTKGFLPPRLTKAQRNAIPSPAAGLMIYQSVDKRIEWYDGTSWVTFSGSLIVANLDGTSSTTAGRSCKALLDSGHSTGNGLYWLDPDGSSSISAFQAYCDMSNGGWTLVTRQLSSVAASTHEVAAAVGTLTAPTQGSVAKLADSVINAIAGNSAAPVYKIDCAGRVNYYKLPSAFSATQTTWTAIQVSVVSDSVSFFTINATYAGCSKGPHSCDASSPSAWGANAGRNPGALYGAGGGFVNTNGCSYSDSTASQSAWSAGSGTTWVK